MRTKRTIEERFWAKVDKNGPMPEGRPDLGPCWLWTAAKIHCPYGHAFDVKNTYYTSKNERQCRICKQAGMKRFYQKRKRVEQLALSQYEF